MNGWLLDTNIVSEFYPGRQGLDRAILDWLKAEWSEGRVYISAVTIQEIAKGAEKLSKSKRGDPARAEKLWRWLENLVALYRESILPIDLVVALDAGRLEGAVIADGHNPQFADVLIAATARHHRLVVLSRNLRDFEQLGINCITPETIVRSP
ncbi:type II toxin-antitoxin system VapC family toxin [Rhizobium sp. FKL33]|uniref:type II toxin-antitoxin system VapC family toxin n=1 Tax=Rhizobium sp. FKL33 TaxID=2562307 RepID=UPI0010BFC7C5|nr:type II toxin-antitoxin system VapC family toxin [Rhizobium sp. FKL33]